MGSGWIVTRLVKREIRLSSATDDSILDEYDLNYSWSIVLFNHYCLSCIAVIAIKVVQASNCLITICIFIFFSAYSGKIVNFALLFVVNLLPLHSNSKIFVVI